MNNQKKIWILLGVIVLLVLIIILLTTKKVVNNSGEDNISTCDLSADEIIDSDTQALGSNASGQKNKTAAVVDMRGAKAEIPGANLVTVDKKVVTPSGQIVQSDIMPNTAQAPKSTVVAKDQLPKTALVLEIGNGLIKPNVFTVKAGQLVNLAVTSSDNQAHVFIFTDSAVGAIAMGISGGQTKAVSFNAPAAGEYYFRCDIPGHKEKGEVGKMIVK